MSKFYINNSIPEVEDGNLKLILNRKIIYVLKFRWKFACVITFVWIVNQLCSDTLTLIHRRLYSVRVIRVNLSQGKVQKLVRIDVELSYLSSSQLIVNDCNHGVKSMAYEPFCSENRYRFSFISLHSSFHQVLFLSRTDRFNMQKRNNWSGMSASIWLLLHSHQNYGLPWNWQVCRGDQKLLH